MPGKTPPPPASLHEVGDYVAWGLMAVCGLVGLLLAVGAHDDEMYLFGWALAAFAVVFLFAELKRHYDMADAARARQRGTRHE